MAPQWTIAQTLVLEKFLDRDENLGEGNTELARRALAQGLELEGRSQSAVAQRVRQIQMGLIPRLSDHLRPVYVEDDDDDDEGMDTDSEEEDLELLEQFEMEKIYLKKVKVSAEEGVDSSCTVCLGDYTEGDLVLQLPCQGKHRFHHDCITTWLLGEEENHVNAPTAASVPLLVDGIG